MKLSIIAGSHRENSQSSKISKYIEQAAKKQNYAPNVIDLKGNPYPLWDESVWSDKNWQNGVFNDVAKQLDESEAFVIVAPEWSGMVPAGLKNFLLLVGKQMADKPSMIVAVSSGYGGSYVVSELRVASAKNTRIIYTPDHVIVRHCESVLNDFEKPESEVDTYIRSRVDYGLKTLMEYGKALSQVRKSDVLDYKFAPFGM